MISLLALLSTCLGVFLFKDKGSYSSQNLRKAIGWLFNVVALVLFIIEFGTARGTFVYLGIFAFIGMSITLMTSDKSQSNAE